MREVSASLLAFRWLVVACQAATLLITWPLWRVHALPPMLPALPLPAFDLGPWLLASLAVVLLRATAGVTLHTALLAYAMLVDQTRIQPEVVSLALLLWGTLPSPGARAVARAHLIALWAWAGVNKLLSPAFLATAGAGAFGAFMPTALRPATGWVIALTELGIGVLAVGRPTRRLAGVLAFAVHGGVVFLMAREAAGWNQAVWPWNVALAVAGLVLIVPWRESLRATFLAASLPARAVVATLLVSPAGWWVGITDAYLAHHLYSADVPKAVATGIGTGATWGAFKVPLPPEHRLFEQYFAATCRPGEEMTITDGRRWFRWRGLERRRLACPPYP